MAVAAEEVDLRMRQLGQVCRRHSLRLTHQRMEIFRELAGSEEHPDAETVYRRIRRRIAAVSLDTVYRTLGLLERHGLVHKAAAQSGPARYDANADRHHHFVCTECGLVRDVYSEQMDNVSVPESVRAMGTVTSHQVVLRGVCSKCLPRRRKA